MRTIEQIKTSKARDYSEFPKYQRLNYTLSDVGILLSEIERLNNWCTGLQATALRWATESLNSTNPSGEVEEQG